VADDPQTIVEPIVEIPGSPFGSRNENIIRDSFPNSPIYLHEMTDDRIKDNFQDVVLDGEVIAGLGFATTVQMQYYKNSPPNMVQVGETSASPRGGFSKGFTVTDNLWPVPNIASSPGAPNASGGHGVGADPSFQADLVGTQQTSVSYGSGPSEPSNPSVESERISNQQFNGLIPGNS